MLILPYQFMWISVVSIFLIIGVGLFVYLVLIPLPDLGKYFPKQNWEEKLTYSRNGGNNLENPITKKLSNVLQYPKALDNTVQKDKDPQQEKPSVITGPQGHGFYTSGHWKIDPLGAESFGQFSNPEFLMTEYFASIMSPPVPPEMEENGSTSQHCHDIGNLMVCENHDNDSHSSDYAFMDSQSDSDMVMMMF